MKLLQESYQSYYVLINVNNQGEIFHAFLFLEKKKTQGFEIFLGNKQDGWY